MTNPYRLDFYQSQADWHNIGDLNNLRERHALRAPYYAWYTKDWLPASKQARIVEIAAGSGQFQFFLKQLGYDNTLGIDIDRDQVELARSLALNVEQISAKKFFETAAAPIDCVIGFDILEHLTLEESYDILTKIMSLLTPEGSLILSVPNAESPTGLYTRYSDITHELAFSTTSLRALLFCHGLKHVEFRDPWPAPIDAARRWYRRLAVIARRLESFRYRLLGLGPPTIWSPVLFARASRLAPPIKK